MNNVIETEVVHAIAEEERNLLQINFGKKMNQKKKRIESLSRKKLKIKVNLRIETANTKFHLIKKLNREINKRNKMNLWI